jgi:hypothetical protein
MNWKRILPGILVVIVANAIALIGVSVNRSGRPFETIRLTERELSLERAEEGDNSGIRLRLNWYRGPDFTRTKLQELGFDCPPISEDRDNIRFPLPKIVFAALEYEGQAWSESLSKMAAAPAPDRKGANPGLASRLFAVDAAKTAMELRARFPDAGRHLIVRAMVRAVPGADLALNSNKPPEWKGYVVQILPAEIYVPFPLASELARLDPRPSTAPRYSVTLSYGSKFEPWISSINLLQ